MFQENTKLSFYSHYKIGGQARYFWEPEKIDDLIKAAEEAQKMNASIFVLGAGTNILFGDNGWNGLILKPKLRFIESDGDLSLRVGAGVSIDELLDYSARKGLSGLEWAGGLPGTFGGAIYGNAGAFGGEIKDSVREVLSLDISTPKAKIIRRSNEDCEFDYRSSLFKKRRGKEVILEACLILSRGDEKAIWSAIEEKIHYRKERQPLEYPNIGSIFKNVDLKKIPKKLHREFTHVIKIDPFPVVPTAHLIHESGLKGISCGGAMISPKHPNFIVNVLSASAEDVKKLIALIKNKVKEKFGIELEEEVIILD